MPNYAVMSIVVPLDDATTPDQADLITDEIDKVISKATEQMFYYSDVAFVAVPDIRDVNIAAGLAEALRGIAQHIIDNFRRLNVPSPVPDAVVVRGGPVGREWDLLRRRVNGEDISQD